MTTFFDFFVAPVGVTEYDRSDIHEFAKLLDTTLFPLNFDDDDDEAWRLKNLSIFNFGFCCCFFSSVLFCLRKLDLLVALFTASDKFSLEF